MTLGLTEKKEGNAEIVHTGIPEFAVKDFLIVL